jgi:pyruvate/2-oxoglutarate dehydrogenase complex dihydrolipoamide acyltransferase (E2) component
MSTFIIDVPMPAMGATVSELTIISLAVTPGTRVAKGQKLAELESDKSAFDFESPAEGTIVAVNGQAGSVKSSGQPLFRLETADESLRHLEIQRTDDRGQRTEDGGQKSEDRGPKAVDASATVTPSSVLRPLVWTPRAIKLAQDAGLDHAKITGIEATGPGGRVSGDDVAKYLAGRK